MEARVSNTMRVAYEDSPASRLKTKNSLATANRLLKATEMARRKNARC